MAGTGRAGASGPAAPMLKYAAPITAALRRPAWHAEALHPARGPWGAGGGR